MKSTIASLLALGVVVAAPSVAQANVGTPLMWASALHLFIGNAVIGVLEGGLLAVIFKARPSRAVGLMILANYFSAWIGGVWLIGFLHGQIEFELYSAWSLIWKLVALSYVLTLALEWPFVAGSMGRQARWPGRSILATLVVQSISYSLLFGWYWMVSGTSLYTKMSIVSPDEIVLPEGLVAYYIAADGDIYRRRLDSGECDRFRDLGSIDVHDCLSARKSATDSRQWELIALTGIGHVNEPGEVPLEVSVSSGDLVFDDSVPVRRPSRRGAARVGSARESAWTFRTGYWPIEGLRGKNSKSNEELHFSFETPFLAWTCSYATLLPGDLVLFQLGDDQICLLEPSTRKVARIAFGRGPVVVTHDSAVQSDEGKRLPEIGDRRTGQKFMAAGQTMNASIASPPHPRPLSRAEGERAPPE